MPLSKHYKGHGDEVMSAMKRTYGDSDTAKRVFYATENKNKKNKRKAARKRGSKR
jgi:hypothetical protein